MPRTLAVLLLFVSSTTHAVVIRHDVDDSRYRIDASEFPALADMPGEGHGVLIAPQWVVTAAHTLPGGTVTEISVGGARRQVASVVVHPGFKPLPPEMVATALATGDVTAVRATLAASDDIALIRLAQPINDVAPASLYSGDDEVGQQVKVIGKGGTGTGIDGMGPHDSHRTELRRAFNTIAAADERWLSYAFDNGPDALELEGMSANGDSGGPVLIEVDGQWQVAGLTAWKSIVGELLEFRAGVYGQTSYNLRLSRYAGWIESVITPERRR